MLFSSLEFLYGFLPLTLLFYFLLPRKTRNLTLLLVSLIFYSWGEPRYVFLMLFTIALDYLFGVLLGKFQENAAAKKRILWIAVLTNLLLLGFFKYTDFLLLSLSKIPALSFIKPLGIALPIGISFYTFQALSYVIDVYRNDAEVQKNPLRFGLYVTLFPQLIAGPIVRYHDVDRQLGTRTHSLEMAASGFRTFVAGLSKKVLLANTFGELWKEMYSLPSSEQTVVGAWFGILCFAFQIYFDFSGYSDMAIGLGRIFGFRFLENFDYPYIAKSVTDFWRRWHISLSTWFREYVYIPLGGNRKGRARTYLNLLAVWLLTGIWHGASLNFLLWGLYYAVLLILEKAFLGKQIAKLPAGFQHLYALVAILFGWLIFAFDGSEEALSMSAGLTYFGQMFGSNVSAFASGADLYEILRSAVFLTISVAAALPFPRRYFYRLYEKYTGGRMQWIANAATVVLLLLCTAYLVNSSYNPFLYFRF